MRRVDVASCRLRWSSRWRACAGDARAECVPLLPRPAASYIVPGAQEFVYATPPGGTPLLLDAFAQPDGKVHPAVLVVHGGGWTTGSRVAHIGQFLELLTEAGYQWVAIDYRLGGAGALAGSGRRCAGRARVRRLSRQGASHRRRAGSCVLGEDVGAQLAVTGRGRWQACARIALVGGVYAAAMPLPGVPTLVVHGGADSEVPVGQVARVLRSHRRRRKAAVSSTSSTARFTAPRTGGRRSGTTSRGWSRGSGGCSALAPRSRSPSRHSRSATCSGPACTSA